MAQSPKTLIAEIQKKNFKALPQLLDNSIITKFFDFCHKISLGYENLAENIFRLTLTDFISNQSFKQNLSFEDLLVYSFHEHWKDFSNKYDDLQEKKIPLAFDWENTEGSQIEDLLHVLSPMEREIFLLRYLLNFSEVHIAKVTGMNVKQIEQTFFGASEKIFI